MELPLSELELNCKNGIDPGSVVGPGWDGTRGGGWRCHLPCDQLDEVGVEDDARSGVEHAAVGGRDEVGRDDLLFRVAEDPLHRAIGRRLHRRLDLIVRRLRRHTHRGDTHTRYISISIQHTLRTAQHAAHTTAACHNQLPIPHSKLCEAKLRLEQRVSDYQRSVYYSHPFRSAILYII